MQLQDIELVCKESDCGRSFTVTAGEQEFFAANNMSTPKRCKSCRDRRKGAQPREEKQW